MNLMCVFRPEFSKVLKQMLIFKHVNDLISVKWSTSACSEFKDYHGPKCFAERGVGLGSRQSTNPKHNTEPGRKRDLGKVMGGSQCSKENNVQGMAENPG